MPVRDVLTELRQATAGLPVGRRAPDRSDTPFPTSGDLERELVPFFVRHGFAHHVELRHPRTGERFEYDFFHADFGNAVEVMGYRADDEVYKDIRKFHVHDATRVGIVWVPRWKWISGDVDRDELPRGAEGAGVADSFMRVEALVAMPYDWKRGVNDRWTLQHFDGDDARRDEAKPRVDDPAMDRDRGQTKYPSSRSSSDGTKSAPPEQPSGASRGSRHGGGERRRQVAGQRMRRP